MRAALLLAAASVVAAHGTHDGLLRHRHIHARAPGDTSTTLPSAGATSLPGTTPAASQTTTTTTTPGTAATPTTPLPAGPVITPARDAVPLAQIIKDSGTDPAGDKGPNPAAWPTVAAKTPVGLTGAPALPDISAWKSDAYPPGDVAPPLDSPEVIEWIQQVRNSGIVIPEIKPHQNAKDGELCVLPQNTPRIGNATECWWTCGHCSRKTDVVDCTSSKAWGSSFDDGPTEHTGKLINYLEAQKLKTTFFVVGTRVKYNPRYLQTEYLLGHQIGVHTWSHTALTTQTSEQVIAELGWTKKVIKDAIGVTPLYFRAPYGDIDDRVRAIGKAMNMTPVQWSVTKLNGRDFAFDTFDWHVPGGENTAAEAVAQFSTLLGEANKRTQGFTVLAHDLWWSEVALAVGYYLPGAVQQGYTIETVGQCMSTKLQDTYAETNTANKLPAGSGAGDDVVFTGTVAPPNAPLGGSNGDNVDPTIGADGNKPGAAEQLQTPRTVLAAVLAAGFLAAVPALF